jgi:hypothetical protein
MPNVSVTVPEIDQSVSRPVIFAIIEEVKNTTKIPDELSIFYPGDIQKLSNPGSMVGDRSERFARFASERRIMVEVEEDYDKEAVGTTVVSKEGNLPVFDDPKLGIIIRPIYTTSQVTINFVYRATSKNEVLRWRDDVRMNISRLRLIYLHSLTYHYPLPGEYLEVLKDVHDKREAVKGYGQTFEEYVTSMATNRMTLIGDLTNNTNRLVISETQSRVQGIFDFDTVPEKPQRDDESGYWTISFAYKFSYERPIG